MIKAADILRRCTEARRRRWRTDQLRKQLEDYYNGGLLPNEGFGMDSQSLGIGNKQLRRPHKLLRSTIEHDGGPVEVLVAGLDDFDRTTDTKNALEKALAEWCRDNYRSLAAQIAGDFLITGRAFAWRPNKWDARFRFGRPLHEEGASTDISDDSFWWWAFPYELKLRDVDFLMGTARGADGKGGWQKEGLRELKRYILQKPHSGTESEVSVSDSMVDDPFDGERMNEPLKCYIYFEKSPDRTGVYRKINVRIVSRYSENHSIATLEGEDPDTRRPVLTKKLSLTVKEQDKEQVIYAQDNAFDSIFEALIPWMDDARISGDQYLDEVEGDGKQFLPRLLVMEDMLDSATSGTAFAMQPHFTAGAEVPKRVAQRLQETGLPKFSFAPRGVGMLDKSNVINSSRAGLEIVQALGISIDEEASTNNLPQSFGKRIQTEFAAEANMLTDATTEAVTLRFGFWHSGWDLLWRAVGKTLIRTEGWAKADPSFFESKMVRDSFVEEGGRLVDLKKGRFTFRSRRLPGGADRQTAIQRFMLILSNPNSPAEYQTWAYRELMKLNFGNEVVAHFEGNKRRPDPSQVERALTQTNAALGSFLPVPAERGDDPLVHLQIHGQAFANYLQICASKGFRDATDGARVQALVQHIAFDVANLPGTAQQNAAQMLKQGIAQFESIPEQAPIDEMRLQEAKLQLDTARTQNELANGENLRNIRLFQAQEKAQQAEFGRMAQAKALGQQDRRIAAEEEKQRMAETDTLLTPRSA